MVAGLAASVVVWRRVWPLWLWPACAVAFVLTYQPLRDNHLILIPYAFAVPVAVALGLVAQRLTGARSWPRSRVAVAALGVGWLQQLHRVDLFREPENPALVAAAAGSSALTAPGRPRRRRPADRRRSSPTAACRRELVDTANSRFESGSLTVADAARGRRRPARDDAVAGRAF